MPTTRRQFLKTTAATAALGLADVTHLGSLRAFADDKPTPVPATVRFGPDLEPIIRLIEDTPQEDCVRVLVEQVRRGLPYERLLAGTFFAGIRRLNSFHDVYKIHAVHQISRQLGPNERLLPLFWAVDGFKKRQRDFPNPPLTELTGPLPSPTEAAAVLARSLDAFDLESVERSLVVLSRDKGIQAAREQLWLYGCLNGGAGGHGAIAVATCFRALDAIGWEQAEPVLRIALRDVSALGSKGQPDRFFLPNTVRVDRHIQMLPDGWSGGQPHPTATLELFGLLRTGQIEPACDLAVRQLGDGIGLQAIWDAIHLATAELLVRHASGWGVLSRPLHSNTSTEALRSVCRSSASPRTRLLAVLQAVAWAADKTASELEAKSLREISITDLPPADLPADSGAAVAEIFSRIPMRYYAWDSPNKQAIMKYGERADADAACRQTFSLARERPSARGLFMQAARSWMCRKATSDPHEYKFLAAIFELAESVSPQWQPHLLAASVHYLQGPNTPDFPAVEQARDALGKHG